MGGCPAASVSLWILLVCPPGEVPIPWTMPSLLRLLLGDVVEPIASDPHAPLVRALVRPSAFVYARMAAVRKFL